LGNDERDRRQVDLARAPEFQERDQSAGDERPGDNAARAGLFLDIFVDALLDREGQLEQHFIRLAFPADEEIVKAQDPEDDGEDPEDQEDDLGDHRETGQELQDLVGAQADREIADKDRQNEEQRHEQDVARLAAHENEKTYEEDDRREGAGVDAVQEARGHDSEDREFFEPLEQVRPGAADLHRVEPGTAPRIFPDQALEGRGFYVPDQVVVGDEDCRREEPLVLGHFFQFGQGFVEKLARVREDIVPVNGHWPVLILQGPKQGLGPVAFRAFGLVKIIQVNLSGQVDQRIGRR